MYKRIAPNGHVLLIFPIVMCNKTSDHMHVQMSFLFSNEIIVGHLPTASKIKKNRKKDAMLKKARK